MGELKRGGISSLGAKEMPENTMITATNSIYSNMSKFVDIPSLKAVPSMQRLTRMAEKIPGNSDPF